MTHTTIQPPSAKSRIARETLQEAVSMTAGAVPSDMDSVEWVDYHSRNAGDMSLHDSDLPDGYGVTYMRVGEHLITVGVGPK